MGSNSMRDQEHSPEETIREVLPERGTPHHEMPAYMTRDQQRTNAAHAALDELVEALAVLGRQREQSDAERDLLLNAIAHVLQRGKLGSQSKARLRAAFRAVSLACGALRAEPAKED